MEKGQLGTEVPRRVIFIWEGVVAHLPDQYVIKTLERYKGRLGLCHQALSYWQVNDLAVQAMWSIHQRSPMRIDLCVTSRGELFTKAVGQLATERNWPVRYVFCEAPEALGRLLPTMPDVDRVYYGLEGQRYAYGPQGVFFDARAGQII